MPNTQSGSGTNKCTQQLSRRDRKTFSHPAPPVDRTHIWGFQIRCNNHWATAPVEKNTTITTLIFISIFQVTLWIDKSKDVCLTTTACFMIYSTVTLFTLSLSEYWLVEVLNVIKITPCFYFPIDNKILSTFMLKLFCSLTCFEMVSSLITDYK